MLWLACLAICGLVGAHGTSTGAHATSTGVHATSTGAYATSTGAHAASTGAHATSTGVHVTSTGAHATSTEAHATSGGTKAFLNKAAQDPVTATPSGRIRGSWMETRRGRRFEAYRGIRYAEPPVGELRFQPPRPILHYHEEVDAREDGPACPLLAPRSYYVDEDCLTINVYTPGKRSEPLPVIFFIHPGGFYSMTGRSDLAGPHYLLDRDIVLVTINYRLGSLGFLSTGDELAPGNNGMRDQVVALRWVQRNIAAFGGDPNLVTIAGCSAGSMSVMLHMISPMAKGLFHRGILSSAAPTRQAPLPTHQRHLAVRQAELLDCPTNTSKAMFDCLKTRPWRQFGDSLPGFRIFGFDPVGIWDPVVEPDYGQQRYLHVQPTVAIREGRMHAVPVIISKTTDEFAFLAYTILKNDTLLKRVNSEWDELAPISFMLPVEDSAPKVHRLKQVYLGGRDLANDEASAVGLGGLYRDSITGFTTHRMANLMCRHSPHPVYYAEFAYFGNHSHYEDPTTGKPTGAAHHDDLIYLFTLSYRFPTIPLDSPDSLTVDRMTALWYNFARYGDPNPRGDTPELATLAWPAMTPAARQYLRIGRDLQVRSKMFEDSYEIWEELYPIQY